MYAITRGQDKPTALSGVLGYLRIQWTRSDIQGYIYETKNKYLVTTFSYDITNWYDHSLKYDQNSPRGLFFKFLIIDQQLGCILNTVNTYCQHHNVNSKHGK